MIAKMEAGTVTGGLQGPSKHRNELLEEGYTIQIALLLGRLERRLLCLDSPDMADI